MSFELKKKNYDWRYLFLLSYECAPAKSMGVLAQKLATGAVCVLWIPAEAELLNRAVGWAAGRNSLRDMLPWLGILIFFVLWKRMGYSLGRLFTMKCETETAYWMRQEVVKKCARVPYRLLEDRAFQDLFSFINQDTEEMVWHMLQHSCNFMQFALRILGVYGLLFWQNPCLGVLIFALTIPFLYFMIENERRLYTVRQDRKGGDRRLGYLGRLLRGKEEALERSLFSYSGYVEKQWWTQRDRLWREEKRERVQKYQGNIRNGAACNVVFFLAELFLIAQLAEGQMSLGFFIALSKGVYQALAVLSEDLGWSVCSIERGLYFLNQLSAFVRLPETEGSEEPAGEAEAFETLEFRHVSFRYPRTARYIIKDLNLKLEKGGHYAVVGPNGAGKTTIAKLLTGLYDSYEGSILLNGRELKDYPPERQRAMFSAVYQDSARYEDTIRNNILIGDIRTMSLAETGKDTCKARELEERLMNSLKKLGLYEKIRELPGGWDTWLLTCCDSGTELSDGHWQRIFLARLMMNPAPFRILDEPAKALDPVSESRLYEQFGEISRDKTTLTISHRLGSAKWADKIFVLQEGHLAEEGSHEELMERRGLYAKMYEGQRQWYLKKGRHS